MATDPKKPYGDVNYADPGYQKDGVHRYPLDTAQHVKSAWSYINQAKNSSTYSAEQLAHIKGKIKAAAKKYGIAISDDSSGQKSFTGTDEEVTMDYERRYTPGLLKPRGETDSEGKRSLTIGGYAAVFDKLSRNLGGFVEQLKPGVFNRAANDGWTDVICRYNHDDNILLGTTNSRTLRLKTDEFGLDYEVDMPQSRGDIQELVERGDISQSSFAFRAVEDDWGQTEQGYPLRSLLSLELVDVAPVVTPAYADTTSGLRSLAAKMDVDIEEVKALAATNELRKFFVRTDGPPPTPKEAQKKLITAVQAKAAILLREHDAYESLQYKD